MIVSGVIWEVEFGQGETIDVVCKGIGVTRATYYPWCKEYGGLRQDQAKELKALKKENAQLKKLVTDLSLDKEIPKVAAEENF